MVIPPLGTANQEDASVIKRGLRYPVLTTGVFEQVEVWVTSGQFRHRLGTHLVAGYLRQLIQSCRVPEVEDASQTIRNLLLRQLLTTGRADGEADCAGRRHRLGVG